MYYPERGRELHGVSSFNLTDRQLRNVLPRKGTRTKCNNLNAISPFVKKCITPKGDENRNAMAHDIGEVFVKKCITPKGDENFHFYFLSFIFLRVKKCITPKGDENEDLFTSTWQSDC